MKRVILLILFLIGLTTVSCSNDTTDSGLEADIHYFKIKVGGIELPLDTISTANFDKGSIRKVSDDLFTINATYGFNANSDQLHILTITFDKHGGVVEAKQHSQGIDYAGGEFEYFNYVNFPSNYFHINIVSLDEVKKTIKLNFSGNLYLNKADMNSETVPLSGELNLIYTVSDTPYYLAVNGVEQYCSAKFNTIPWIARNENSYSVFTAPDPYRIEINFNQSAAPGSYNFTPASADNYIHLSKFNTTTLTYDYYNTTGVVAHSYREFHGAQRYSFIGTFSLTAVNPNNPSDIIQVTDGNFRSYQQY